MLCVKKGDIKVLRAAGDSGVEWKWELILRIFCSNSGFAAFLEV